MRNFELFAGFYVLRSGHPLSAFVRQRQTLTAIVGRITIEKDQPMSSGLEFTLSAFKHGYKKGDADTVIYGPLTKTFERGPSELGWRVSFVGFNNTAELLEVLVECYDDREICFHINKASKKVREEYERA